MAQPICIITSTGLKCISSPIKAHGPGKGDCRPFKKSQARNDRVAIIKAALGEPKLKLPDHKQALIADIAELLLAANVGEDTPFTIVRAG